MPDTVFELDLIAYGEDPCSCELYSDDGVSLDYQRGDYQTAIVTVSEYDHVSGITGLERYSVNSVRRVR